jgi:hypothetical protein
MWSGPAPPCQNILSHPRIRLPMFCVFVILWLNALLKACMGIRGWARKFACNLFLPRFSCIGIGISLPVPVPTRADPQARRSPKKNFFRSRYCKILHWFSPDFGLMLCVFDVFGSRGAVEDAYDCWQEIEEFFFVNLRCRIRPSLPLKNDPSPDPHAPVIGAGNLIPVPIHWTKKNSTSFVDLKLICSMAIRSGTGTPYRFGGSGSESGSEIVMMILIAGFGTGSATYH